MREQQLSLDVLDGLGECIAEFFEILLIEKDLVLFVLFFTYSLAFRNRDVEILFRFRRLHVKEIRALSRANAFSEDFIFVGVFQRTSLPIR